MAGAEIFVILHGSAVNGLKKHRKSIKKVSGRLAHFLFVDAVCINTKTPRRLNGRFLLCFGFDCGFDCGFDAMDLSALLETTLAGLGYELVDVERSTQGRLVRVFIDKPGGIHLDDCATVSHHLGRVLTVENVAYERLEVSSPGLDRPLKQERDFVRFAGQKVRVKLRVPVQGQRNFFGVLGQTQAGKVELVAEGKTVVFDLANLDRARLVPNF